MNIERIEVEHNKKITALFSVLKFIFAAILAVCIALICINMTFFTEKIGFALTVAAIVLLSLSLLTVIFLFVNQVIKLKRKIIFIADENGITDYSRHLVLAPIGWNEIKCIEYKGFFSDDLSDLRHLKICLKDGRAYAEKLNFIQKLSYYVYFKELELHLYSGKIKIKELAEKLEKNLEEFNNTSD